MIKLKLNVKINLRVTNMINRNCECSEQSRTISGEIKSGLASVMMSHVQYLVCNNTLIEQKEQTTFAGSCISNKRTPTCRERETNRERDLEHNLLYPLDRFSNKLSQASVKSL